MHIQIKLLAINQNYENLEIWWAGRICSSIDEAIVSPDFKFLRSIFPFLLIEN